MPSKMQQQKSRQEKMLNEILRAQRGGFVQKIEGRIDGGSSELVQSTKSDNIVIRYPEQSVLYGELPPDENAEKTPYANYDALHVFFNEQVPANKIAQVSDYMRRKYLCKTYINGNRLDLYGLRK